MTALNEIRDIKKLYKKHFITNVLKTRSYGCIKKNILTYILHFILSLVEKLENL